VRHVRTQIKHATDGRLGAVERVTLDAFAAERDEDHQGGRRVLAEHDGRERRNRERRRLE